jgi:transposase
MEAREPITLDRQAQQRLWVLNHVLAGEVTVREAAAYLHLSVRSVRRLLARYQPDEGAAALVHGNRGRTPANRLDDELRARLVALASTTYQGVNRAHLADLLAEREGIVVAERTLRRVSPRPGCRRCDDDGRGVTGSVASGWPRLACSSRSMAASTTGSRVVARGSRSWAASTMPPGSSPGPPSVSRRTPRAISRCSSRRPVPTACPWASTRTATASSGRVPSGCRRSRSSSPGGA